MSVLQCRHLDIRKFDGLRCCLACGEAVFETSTVIEANEPQPALRTTYKYTTLNYKLGQEIRLIVLYPGLPADDLHCDIIHVNLDDDPCYEAVSYTWASDDGDASFSRKIDCGDREYIPITSSCDAALRQLRKRGLKRRLWIDAISIDQTNVQERNHQVGLMDRIYSLAQSVRTCIQFTDTLPYGSEQRLFEWLQQATSKKGGDESSRPTQQNLRTKIMHMYIEWLQQKTDNETEWGFFAWLEKGNSNEDRETSLYKAQIITKYVEQMPDKPENEAEQNFFQDFDLDKYSAKVAHDAVFLHDVLDRLLKQRYFKRTWIIQEVVLAKAVYLAVNQSECLLSGKILDILSHVAELKKFQLPGVLELRRSADFEWRGNIFECLRAGIEGNCADPRDKVFAVLSLMNPQARSLIPVDYALDREAVFVNAILATFAIASNFDTLVLRLARYATWRGPTTNCSTDLALDQFASYLNTEDIQERCDDDPPVISNIPIGRDTHFRQLRCASMGRWRASVEIRIADDMGIAPDVSNEDALLLVAVCHRPQDPAYNIMPRLQVRAHVIDVISDTNEYFNAYDTFRGFQDAKMYAHLLLHPTYKHIDGRGLDLVRWYNRISTARSPQDLASTDTVPWPLISFIKAAQEHGEHRKFFGTPRGIGFASPGFEPGHEVWVLDGAKLPLILCRKGHKLFQCVSDCYLWTTLEPDYWAPDQSHENQSARYDRQTHIIEIDW